eukprot:49765-Chlamydomonas_euryale.AAC.1
MSGRAGKRGGARGAAAAPSSSPPPLPQPQHPSPAPQVVWARHPGRSGCWWPATCLAAQARGGDGRVAVTFFGPAVYAVRATPARHPAKARMRRRPLRAREGRRPMETMGPITHPGAGRGEDWACECPAAARPARERPASLPPTPRAPPRPAGPEQ